MIEIGMEMAHIYFPRRPHGHPPRVRRNVTTSNTRPLRVHHARAPCAQLPPPHRRVPLPSNGGWTSFSLLPHSSAHSLPSSFLVSPPLADTTARTAIVTLKLRSHLLSMLSWPSSRLLGTVAVILSFFASSSVAAWLLPLTTPLGRSSYHRWLPCHHYWAMPYRCVCVDLWAPQYPQCLSHGCCGRPSHNGRPVLPMPGVLYEEEKRRDLGLEYETTQGSRYEAKTHMNSAYGLQHDSWKSRVPGARSVFLFFCFCRFHGWTLEMHSNS